jgi:hypothetical protein
VIVSIRKGGAYYGVSGSAANQSKVIGTMAADEGIAHAIDQS